MVFQALEFVSGGAAGPVENPPGKGATKWTDDMKT